ncbi:MAG: BPSS1780 family membrane protein [Nitrosospira sp.]
MEVRQVDAKHGWQWIMSGFFLFRRAPLVWIILCATLLLIAATLALIPLAGQFIFTLLSPVFLAGMMAGCKTLNEGGRLEITHLLAGFQGTASPLITIGGIYLVGQVMIVGVFMLVGGDVLMGLLLDGKRVDESELRNVSGDMLSASLVALVLTIPLLMAVWFAPLLVKFDNMQALDAMRSSFVACLRNIVPLQVYGITLVVVMTILMMLVSGLLGPSLVLQLAVIMAMSPIMFASIYASYRDIFQDPTEAT